MLDLDNLNEEVENKLVHDYLMEIVQQLEDIADDFVDYGDLDCAKGIRWSADYIRQLYSEKESNDAN